MRRLTKRYIIKTIDNLDLTKPIRYERYYINDQLRVQKKSDIYQKEILDKGNCITVSPVDGSAFYQEKDFLGRGGAGSSIILLYNENLNKYNGYLLKRLTHLISIPS